MGIDAATSELVKAGYVLGADAVSIRERAAQHWDYLVNASKAE